MHLNDAFGREPMLDVVCCHHEQACSMAAESYARISNLPAAVNVTSGPGGINALNGVFGAFVDSIPMIVISGQVKRETLVSSYELPLRQLGDQEVDIVAMARPVCKDAILLTDPEDAKFEIQRALWLARAGRPGPVWIDVPIDVQSALVDPDSLRALRSPGRRGGRDAPGRARGQVRCRTRGRHGSRTGQVGAIRAPSPPRRSRSSIVRGSRRSS